MKKRYYKIFSIILSLIICLNSFSVCSYCDTQDTIEKFYDFWLNDSSEWINSHMPKIIKDIYGVVLPSVTVTNDIMGTVLFSKGTTDTYNEWLKKCVSVSNPVQKLDASHRTGLDKYDFDINFDDDFINEVGSVVNDYLDEHGYKYVYSYNISDYWSFFTNKEYYQALQKLCNEYQDNYFICLQSINPSNENSIKVVLVPKVEGFSANGSNDFYSLVYSSFYKNSLTSYYLCNRFNNISWSNASLGGGIASFYYGYFVDDTIKLYSTSDRPSNYSSAIFVSSIVVKDNLYSSWDGSACSNWITNGSTYQEIMYMSVDDAKGSSVGQRPFYITDSYNNSSSIEGSYNTTSSNIDNSITYGDVNNFINNYYNDNTNGNGENVYPSTQQVNVYINNYVPPTNNNSSSDDNGGGSSSSGGSSSTDDNGLNLGWLSKIGEIIGALISTIGEVLAGALDAIVNLFDSLVIGIPTIFGDFLGAIFGWLPPEIITVLTLGITCMVLFGIFKIFK